MKTNTVIPSAKGGWEVRTPQAVRQFHERSEAIEWARVSLPQGGRILVSSPHRQVWPNQAA